MLRAGFEPSQRALESSQTTQRLGAQQDSKHTVDGRYPAPPWMVETL